VGSFSNVTFANHANGANAFIINVDPNAFIDIRDLTTGGTTLGAIAGVGWVYLGSNTLTVGGNNLSTIFAGIITDQPKSGEQGPPEGPPEQAVKGGGGT